MGILSPSLATASATGGALGEYINQRVYGDGTFDLERIVNASIIGWASGCSKSVIFYKKQSGLNSGGIAKSMLFEPHRKPWRLVVLS